MSLADPQKKLAQTLVKKGLGTPAIFVLECMKPFSVVAQQTMYATSPFANFSGFQRFHADLSGLFEDRDNLEEMMLEVERLMEEDDE